MQTLNPAASSNDVPQYDQVTRSAGGGAEKVAAASGTSGTVTLDLNSASVFTLTPTAAVTTLSITNVPTSRAVSVRLCVTQGGTPYAIATPSGGVFYGAATPTPVSSKKTIYDYFTVDGGTSWHCSGTNQV